MSSTKDTESSNMDRLQFFFMNLVGHVVCVHTADGAVLEGLFVSRSDDDAAEASVLLSRTRNRRSTTCGKLSKTVVNDMLQIALRDVVYMEACAVRVEAAAAGRVEPFRSGNLSEMNWAELMPEDDKLAGDLEDEEKKWVPGKWDQFATNEKKFGVKSTYSEEQYTTVLDKSKFTKEQIDLADRLSRDIEKTAARGIQHRIERGEEVEEDEGALYSDVQRTQAPPPTDGSRRPIGTQGKSAAYVPPAKKLSAAAVETPALAAAQPAAAPAARRDGQSPPSIEAGSTATSGASPNSSSGKLNLNFNAKPFVPGGAPVAAPPVATGPVHIDDMLAAVAKAMELRAAAVLYPALDWAGDDDGEDYSAQFAAPVHHHHQQPHLQHLQHNPHHSHHSHHTHHHSHHHNQAPMMHPMQSSFHGHQSQPQHGFPGHGNFSSGGSSAQFRAPHSPTTSGAGLQPPSGVGAAAPTRVKPTMQQQPQQPVVAATASPAGPAPVSVSDEPRRGMSTGLSRGARAGQNPTRHEDPQPTQAPPSAATQPPGSSIVSKKRGGK